MARKITRKQFIYGAAAAAGAAAGGYGLSQILGDRRAPGQIKRRKYNVLLLTTDQERIRQTYPAGLDLPHRARLLEAGVEFPNFHVNAVACGPARSVIYTGQHIQHTRVYDNPGDWYRNNLDPYRTRTLPQMLKDRGYYTAYKGKWHLSQLHTPKVRMENYMNALRDYGIDEYHPVKDTYGAAHDGFEQDPMIAEFAADWLADDARRLKDEGRPWFLAVNLINPHDIMFYDATGRQKETRLSPGYIDEVLPAPDTPLYNEDLGFALPDSFADDLTLSPEAHRAYVEDANYVYGPIPHEDREAWYRWQNYYFNCLRDVDRHIGTVLDALEASGEADNTIVIFTGDHGEMAAAHGHRLKGPFIYKENVQVPLVIAHPDGAAGKASAALSSSVDLAPTVLSLTGMDAGARAETYPDLRGYDLSGAVSAPDRPTPRDEKAGALLCNFSAVYPTNPDKKRAYLEKRNRYKARGEDTPRVEFPEEVLQTEIRSWYRGCFDGRYRFVRYFRPDQHHRPEDWKTLRAYNDLELFDTRLDPDETSNLALAAEENKALILRMNEKLNGLIDAEVGVDDGSHMPGDPEMWRLG